VLGADLRDPGAGTHRETRVGQSSSGLQLTHEAEREQQTVAVARFIEDMVDGASVHVIVAGDMDATPDAASIRFWTGKQSLDGLSVCYRDAWSACHPGDPGLTFTRRTRSCRSPR
jgi:hypothetical protein